MCLKFLPPEKHINRESTKLTDRIRVWATDFLDSIESRYVKWLEWALGHKKTIIGMIVGIAVLSFGLVKFIGTEFFPDQDEGQFNLTVKLPVGTRPEVTDGVMRQIEGIVRQNVPEVQTLLSDVGVPSAKGGNLFGSNSGSHSGSLQVALVPIDQRKRSEFEIINALRPKLTAVPGAAIFINPGGFLRFLLNFGSSAPVDVEIRGYDLETGAALAKKVAAIAQSVQGATDIQISREDNLPELRVKIDRERAGVLGVSVADVANTINTCINGSVASLFSDPVNGNQYNILVRFGEDFRSHIEDLRDVVVATNTGQEVLLGSIATIERAAAPVQVSRKYQQRLIEITGNVSGRDLGSVSNDIQKQLDTLTIPAGFEVKQTGNVEQQKEAFRTLTLALFLAILLVYVVMASQFQSLIDPFIIMFTVPLGVVGVLWILFLTNTTLSVTSFQGVIIMIGIVVSNGVLLVDYTNHLRVGGANLRDAVIKGGSTRLKPILMTSLVTVIGLIPMALGLGGEKTQAPLAIAVIGGLTVSTMLTLFFIPVLYTVFEQKFRREMKAPEVDV